jgi:uncharacterized protein YchJ
MVWTGLEIIATNAGTAADSQGEVEFIAHFKSFGKVGLFTSVHAFLKRKGVVLC